jgi:hypothetical protein
MIDVRWIWLFLDTVGTDAGPSWEFWRQVTHSTLSPTRGDRSEFATFLPEQGDPWVKVQAVQSGGGVHLDLPELSYAVDAVFWHELTGWDLGSGAHHEFSSLNRPDGIPVRILLQRKGERDGTASAHVDLACTDRAATRGQHEQLGAQVVREGPSWTVMSDPVGRTYCLTDRDPATGLRPAG